jgi:hypothetical protein
MARRKSLSKTDLERAGVRLGRRTLLRGLFGVTLSLPVLEGLAPRSLPGPGTARADDGTDPFLIVFRQANGVATARSDGGLGVEPERFWPRVAGPLDVENVTGRALDELERHLDRLTVLGNVNMGDLNYGDGHANGALTLLTAARPVLEQQGADSVCSGESLDVRIAEELNPEGVESFFLQVGPGDGMGGPCISWRGQGIKQPALRDPMNAFTALVGGQDPNADPDAIDTAIATRRQSVNDLLREQFDAVLSRPELSAGDRLRLSIHRDAIRDVERRVTCQLDEDLERRMDGVGEAYDSEDGDDVIRAAEVMLDLMALAVACGSTRVAVLQMGDAIDGTTRYRDPRDGQLMENFHYVSHRRLSHNLNGPLIPETDLQHSFVDRMFARMFGRLVDRLVELPAVGHDSLLDAGVAAWMNDLGYGPTHSPLRTPVVLAGTAGGYLREGGDYVWLPGEDPINHPKLLNTLGTAVGLRSPGGGPLVDFGQVGAQGLLPELLAGNVTDPFGELG